MSIYRKIMRALGSRPIAMVDPRHLAQLIAAAQDPAELVPTGEESAADEPELDSGILVYRIRGTIVHHWTDGFDAWGMVSPSEWLIETLTRAAADESIRGVLLDIDSGGGMAVGTPEAAEAVYRFRESGRLIWAIANGSMYSAAAYIGMAAQRVLVTPSGGVGSIGTLMVHQEMTKLLDDIGIRVEIVRATKAENKARINPFEALTDEEREVALAELDTINEKFLADVARFRGMDPDSVAEVSELGRTFLAEAAVERGLADAVMTLEEALAEMRAELGDPLGDDPEEPDEMRSVSGLHEVRNLTPEDGTEVRAVDGERAQLQGTGLRYGSLSRDMGGWREEFAEGAFAESIAQDDLRVVWQHNQEKVFGRVKAGTARIWEEAGAVRYTADPPNTQWARDAMESIRRGDVDQNSFRFIALKQRWERRNGVDVRVVLKAALVEVGPQTHPAYEDTKVAVASLNEWRGTETYAAALAAEGVPSDEVYRRRAVLREMTL